MGGCGVFHNRTANAGTAANANYAPGQKRLRLGKEFHFRRVIHFPAKHAAYLSSAAGINLPIVSGKLNAIGQAALQVRQKIVCVYGRAFPDQPIDNQLGFTIYGNECELLAPFAVIVFWGVLLFRKTNRAARGLSNPWGIYHAWGKWIKTLSVARWPCLS
jgi:hypothetical protein